MKPKLILSLPTQREILAQIRKAFPRPVCPHKDKKTYDRKREKRIDL